MHYIKDIFEKKKTEHAHNKFIRYSKGEFQGPILKVRFQKEAIKLNSSFHFVDELLMLAAKKLGNNIVHIKGTLLWNRDLVEDLMKLGIKYSKVSKSRGIFKYTLENDVKFKDFVDAFSNFHLLINMKTDDMSIVMKNSFPKPNKEFSGDFCKVTFPKSLENEIKKEFLFDVKEKCKEVKVKHDIIITEIDIPKIDNFEEARKLAKRVGTIKRVVSIDKGEEKISQTEFKV